MTSPAATSSAQGVRGADGTQHRGGRGRDQRARGLIRAGQAEAQRTADAGNRRIAELEAEVARVREAMQQAVAEQEACARAANDEKVNIQPGLEFFGQEAVAQVVQDSAKLSPPR
ncbi:MAG: hypothetical protein A2V77_16685 [Anaeromyxobacter sp. RBG_16_69_14]|nr:MAG: hypothetical protein A2V77_16685 [Anaeromyxobacter sp. RBG_16_69_14]